MKFKSLILVAVMTAFAGASMAQTVAPADTATAAPAKKADHKKAMHKKAHKAKKKAAAM